MADFRNPKQARAEIFKVINAMLKLKPKFKGSNNIDQKRLFILKVIAPRGWLKRKWEKPGASWTGLIEMIGRRKTDDARKR